MFVSELTSRVQRGDADLRGEQFEDGIVRRNVAEGRGGRAGGHWEITLYGGFITL